MADGELRQTPHWGGLRVVGAKRLSRFTDATTSPEVQEEMIIGAQRRVGGAFVGWATDLDISAIKTTPWERPELAYWLENPELWDVLIWQRMDRAVRSMADMADLGRYAKKHRKRLIFASGPGGDMLELDFASPMSELIMLILAFAAQMEGQTIMERTQGAAAHLESLGRWAGGPVPYGWAPGRKVFEDGKEGWWLFRHTDDDPTRSTSEIRLGMIARAVTGKNYTEILRWLEEMSAITPWNHRALLATPPRDLDPESAWNVTVVRDMLQSALNRGHTVKRDGTVVRDDNGAPILQAEPLIDDATSYELKEALKLLENGLAGKPRSDGHELLGILECSICERNLVKSWTSETKGKGKNRVRTDVRVDIFRCNGKYHPEGVPGISMKAVEVFEWIDGQFLAHIGPFRRTQVLTTPGIDHRPEIEELQSDVDQLSARLARLRGPAADAVEKQLIGRSNRLEELREAPFVPASQKLVELDETWGDAWRAAPDWAAKAVLMRSVGVRVEALPAEGWRPDISTRLRFHVGQHVDPVQDALDDVAYQEGL
ncbi:recombinase family protein [Streptomyces sp. NPDC017964]|uniref:recombinase family protein n=1 Tax=Streptomyces sp. NPDC017964 TaxID=3365022 RepID=UPI0037A73261